MTNFEHYKDEIEKAINDNLLYLFLEQHGYKTDATDAYKLTRWYLAEYVESYKLTQIEKVILEKLGGRENCILKNGQVEHIWFLDENGVLYYTLRFLSPEIEFECLEWDKEYKIADILDNCEVIG